VTTSVALITLGAVTTDRSSTFGTTRQTILLAGENPLIKSSPASITPREENPMSDFEHDHEQLCIWCAESCGRCTDEECPLTKDHHVEDLYCGLHGNACEQAALREGKVASLMSAVKYNLLAQIDRSEHRDEETHLPYNEVAVLYTAYAAMGGDLNQFSSNIYDWPQWEQDLAADCKRTLEQED